MSDQIQIPQIQTGVNNIQVVPIGVQNVPNNNIQIRLVKDQTVRPLGDLRVWMNTEPVVNVPQMPVVYNIGNPIVNMPGCVEAHKENTKGNQNTQLVNDDPKGNVVLCDGGMPYYVPPNYDARELTWQTVQVEEEEAEGVDTTPSENVEPPPPPGAPPTPPGDKPIECPPPNARRIGDLNQAGTERVTGYKLNPEETICITLWEDVPPVEQFIPSAPVVSTTAVIATVATTSALLAKPLADLLLKVVKPAVKKAITAVKKKLGREELRPTRQETISNRYRQSKGLPDLKPSRRLK